MTMHLSSVRVSSNYPSKIQIKWNFFDVVSADMNKPWCLKLLVALFQRAFNTGQLTVSREHLKGQMVLASERPYWFVLEKLTECLTL